MQQAIQQWILIAVLAIMVYTVSLDLRPDDFRYMPRSSYAYSELHLG